jgi:hypothetical protein
MSPMHLALGASSKQILYIFIWLALLRRQKDIHMLFAKESEIVERVWPKMGSCSRIVQITRC